MAEIMKTAITKHLDLLQGNEFFLKAIRYLDNDYSPESVVDMVANLSKEIATYRDECVLLNQQKIGYSLADGLREGLKGENHV